MATSRAKYGSLTRTLGAKISQLSSPRKAESPSLKSKKRSEELTNGLKKLSGNKKITPELIEWINTIELNGDKENLSSRSSRIEELKKESAAAAPPASPTTKRGSLLKRVENAESDLPKKGKLYIRVAEVKHKLKQPKDERDLICTVTVQKCTLATTPVDFKNSISFEEGFIFDIQGDFDVVLQVFSQPKDKEVREIPESLGTLTFSGLSVLPVEMLTGDYYLNKDGADTSSSITLQFAIKIQDDEDLEREKLPEPDFAGNLSRQLLGNAGGYNWVLDECELRSRTLRFYNQNNKVKTLTLDYRSKVEKKAEADSGEMLPYNCFQIWVAGQPVILMAQTKEERDAWIETLSKAALCAF